MKNRIGKSRTQRKSARKSKAVYEVAQQLMRYGGLLIPLTAQEKLALAGEPRSIPLNIHVECKLSRALEESIMVLPMRDYQRVCGMVRAIGGSYPPPHPSASRERTHLDPYDCIRMAKLAVRRECSPENVARAILGFAPTPPPGLPVSGIEEMDTIDLPVSLFATIDHEANRRFEGDKVAAILEMYRIAQSYWSLDDSARMAKAA